LGLFLKPKNGQIICILANSLKKPNLALSQVKWQPCCVGVVKGVREAIRQTQKQNKTSQKQFCHFTQK